MLYAVYLAYHKREILSDEALQDPNIPEYPKELARVRVYDNKQSQIDCYANTMCPASQLIEAKDMAELEIKVSEMEANFNNEDWLEVNIRPYI